MIAEYINYLKKEYLTLSEIKRESTLNKGQWNMSSYKRLSNLIFDKLNDQLDLTVKQKMGTTISDRTLYNIFENKRKINSPIDQRSLNTLNKLSIFCNYKDWNTFVESRDKALDKKKGKKVYSEKVKHLILKAKEAEFHSYNSLPEINPNGLENYYTKSSSAFAEITSLIEEYSSSDLVISNPYNPSSYEILSLEVEKSELKEDYYIASTEEYWIFCWFDISSKKYIKREKKLQKHKYMVFHDKKKNKWLIDVNGSN